MSAPEDFVFKKLEPFIIRPDNEDDGNHTSSQSESSSVSRLLNALSSLTCNEGRDKDGTNFSTTMPLISAKLENIQPIARRIPSLAKVSQLMDLLEYLPITNNSRRSSLSMDPSILLIFTKSYWLNCLNKLGS